MSCAPKTADTSTEIVRASSTALLLYAAYTVWFCPCSKLGSCHLTNIYGAIFLVVAMFACINGPRVRNYHS